MRIVWWLPSSRYLSAVAIGVLTECASKMAQLGMHIDVLNNAHHASARPPTSTLSALRSADLIHVMGEGRPPLWMRLLAAALRTPLISNVPDAVIQHDVETDGHGKDMANTLFELYRTRLGLDTRTILGVALQVTSANRAVRRVDDAIATRQPVRVAFANAHTLNIAATFQPLREALQSFYVLNDGLGVDLASRWKVGRRFSDNLNGTDFVPHYLDASRHALRIFLLGSSQDVAESAARNLKRRWTKHTIVGTRHGFFSGPEDEAEVARQIRAAQPDLVLVGMGNPLQELWIARHGEATGAAALFGVGAFLDFTSGRVARAPEWVRSIRCEWLWRLASEPKRMWRRYLLGNVMFVIRVLRDTRTPATSSV